MRKGIIALAIALLIALPLVYRQVRVEHAAANLRLIGQQMLLYSRDEAAGGFPRSGFFVPQPATEPTTQPESSDAGADIVAAFYHALLQKDPPTAAQEHALLVPEGLAYRLVIAHPDPRDDIEPMDRTKADLARLDAEEARVQAAGPVVLDYFRQHKEWFLPKKMRSFNDIVISNTLYFVRRGDRILLAPPARNGMVIAQFTDDRGVPPDQQRLRTIVFILEAGKIAPDAICLDGFFPVRTPVHEFLKANPIPDQ